ncbi:Hypothetical predicted protein [Pelobates cultripes]|uniref:HeH/LEM domain-containing protein n=1 Tax=Pelobates cultripes TaxID=61616 RepID=A0AAD1RAZ7_PELCU|nr:Hypothetical predicted protein [Pelobates cultripes]
MWSPRTPNNVILAVRVLNGPYTARPPTPTTAPTAAESQDPSSPCSLRAWTIPKIAAELRHRGLSYPATATKAELYKIMMPSPDNPQPGSRSQDQIIDTLTGIQTTMAAMLASISSLNQRVEKCETPAPATVSPPIPLIH